MRPRIPSSAKLERIEQESAEWILRRDRGLTAVEQDEFSKWLAEDPRHGEGLMRQRQNWERLDRLAEWLPEHGPRPNRDLLMPTRKSRPWRLPASAVALAAAAAVAFLFWRPSTPESANPPITPIQLGSIQEKTLEDGSVVVLNRGAEVSVLYTASERRVELQRGEAHFTVTKNPARPFIVSAAGVDVRAVGTAFNVKQNTAQVEVLVTEGRVHVVSPLPSGDPTAHSPLVEAGQLAVVALQGDKLPHITTLTRLQADERLDWQPRILDFTKVALSNVVAEFSRRNAVKIIFADQDMAAMEISASLRSDNVEGFVRLLEAGFSIKSERVGDTIILRKVR